MPRGRPKTFLGCFADFILYGTGTLALWILMPRMPVYGAVRIAYWLASLALFTFSMLALRDLDRLPAKENP